MDTDRRGFVLEQARRADRVDQEHRRARYLRWQRRSEAPEEWLDFLGAIVGRLGLPAVLLGASFLTISRHFEEWATYAVRGGTAALGFVLLCFPLRWLLQRLRCLMIGWLTLKSKSEGLDL